MSLLTDGTNYFLQPNGGSAVELSYSGAPVYAGEFGQSGRAPIAAAQTASGYEVAFEDPGRRSVSRFGTPTAAAITLSIPLRRVGIERQR